MLICASGFSFAQTEETSDMISKEVKIEILFNDEVIEDVEIMEANTDLSFEDKVLDESRLKVSFDKGYLLVNQEDYDVWDFSHVLAVRVRQSADETYSFDVTVRHRDEGWEHYADMFRIVAANEDGIESSVENGERVLLHPHDNEQPFTRSQSRVVATGVVCIEAKDTVHEWGGSSLCLDLTKLDFTNSPITISWKLLSE